MKKTLTQISGDVSSNSAQQKQQYCDTQWRLNSSFLCTTCFKMWTISSLISFISLEISFDFLPLFFVLFSLSFHTVSLNRLLSVCFSVYYIQYVRLSLEFSKPSFLYYASDCKHGLPWSYFPWRFLLAFVQRILDICQQNNIFVGSHFFFTFKETAQHPLELATIIMVCKSILLTTIWQKGTHLNTSSCHRHVTKFLLSRLVN